MREKRLGELRYSISYLKVVAYLLSLLYECYCIVLGFGYLGLLIFLFIVGLVVKGVSPIAYVGLELKACFSGMVLDIYSFRQKSDKLLGLADRS